MSLDIIATDPIKTEMRWNGFMNKYNIPLVVQKLDEPDIWDWLYSAGEDSDDELRNNPHKYCALIINWRKEMSQKLKDELISDPDLKNYDTLIKKLAEKAEYDLPDDTYEVDNFHIGYGGFYWIRQELANFCGAHYYTVDDGSVFGQTRISYPEWWGNGNRIGRALLRFFLHSDCDGQVSEEDIHLLAKYFWDNQIRSKVAKRSTSDWKPKVLAFLDFVQKSSHNSVYWEFM